jgi:hypothetical protein
MDLKRRRRRMMASPCSFPICGPHATATRGSASLTAARISRIANEAADCGASSSADADAEPGACEGSASDTADSTADGCTGNRPFRAGAGGRPAGEGDDSPDHQNFTHHSYSTDGSPTIPAVSTQFLKI